MLRRGMDAVTLERPSCAPAPGPSWSDRSTCHIGQRRAVGAARAQRQRQDQPARAGRRAPPAHRRVGNDPRPSGWAAWTCGSLAPLDRARQPPAVRVDPPRDAASRRGADRHPRRAGELADRVHRRRALRVATAELERAGAAHLAERSLGTLSQGERARVLLARAQAGRPELLLLDEPCGRARPALTRDAGRPRWRPRRADHRAGHPSPGGAAGRHQPRRAAARGRAGRPPGRPRRCSPARPLSGASGCPSPSSGGAAAGRPAACGSRGGSRRAWRIRRARAASIRYVTPWNANWMPTSRPIAQSAELGRWRQISTASTIWTAPVSATSGAAGKLTVAEVGDELEHAEGEEVPDQDHGQRDRARHRLGDQPEPCGGGHHRKQQAQHDEPGAAAAERADQLGDAADHQEPADEDGDRDRQRRRVEEGDQPGAQRQRAGDRQPPCGSLPLNTHGGGVRRSPASPCAPHRIRRDGGQPVPGGQPYRVRAGSPGGHNPRPQVEYPGRGGARLRGVPGVGAVHLGRPAGAEHRRLRRHQRPDAAGPHRARVALAVPGRPALRQRGRERSDRAGVAGAGETARRRRRPRRSSPTPSREPNELLATPAAQKLWETANRNAHERLVLLVTEGNNGRRCPAKTVRRRSTCSRCWTRSRDDSVRAAWPPCCPRPTPTRGRS